MTTSESSIPIIYCRIILAAVCRSTADTDAMLTGTGITQETLKEIDAGISTAGYRRLIQNARRVSGDDAIMLEAGHKVPITAHGPLGHAAIYSPTWYAVFKICEQFSKLRADFMTMTIRDNGAHTDVYFEIDDALGEEKEAALDFIMAGMAASRSALKLSPLIPLFTRLKRKRPDNHARYRDILACDVLYDQADDSLVFSTADLHQPLPVYDPKEFAAATHKCQQLLNQSRTPLTTREAVEMIFERNPGLICSIERVAQHFNISARTLQRRLREENTHYQLMLDDWLKLMALRYLEQERLSTEVTAAMLGYSDEANFRRAFKRWFGVPPSQYAQRKNEKIPHRNRIKPSSRHAFFSK
ncbi:MAG TPA: AraC family transcriptional regulator [Pseudomonadales bacterium]|nr:AraC family transcriptional regulator [Pseudomonadales bacterium]